MGLDPLVRFSSRVQDYVRYRPSYPQEIVPLLVRECGLTQTSRIADVGSGTGLLAQLFLKFGCKVTGVEPNAEMRRAGEEFLAGYPAFSSVAGQAERTGLPDGSVDMITAGQAFHWFQPEETRREFRRILRPDGWVVLIWNERRVTSDGFLAGYEDLVREYAPEYGVVDHRRIGAEAITAFYEHDRWRLAEFEYVQEFDLAGARGRLASSSYAPQPGAAQYEAMMNRLDELFKRWEVNGRVSMVYDTLVYFGRL